MNSQTLLRPVPKQGDQPIILIVEDDWPMRELLVRILQEETGYRAWAVADASQAVEAAQALRPDLFILDYGLPGVNGIETHDLLHSIAGLETVPTLMLSVFNPSREAMHERQITYLRKPFDLDILLSVITTLLSRAHA